MLFLTMWLIIINTGPITFDGPMKGLLWDHGAFCSCRDIYPVHANTHSKYEVRDSVSCSWIVSKGSPPLPSGLLFSYVLFPPSTQSGVTFQVLLISSPSVFTNFFSLTL